LETTLDNREASQIDLVERAVPPAAGAGWLACGDAMRVLGILAVLVVHTCDMIVFSEPAGSTHWWVANVLDATGRWAVPVFIMLSGALLLRPSRPQTAVEFYRRRAARLGVAIVFWSVVFMLFAVYYTGWSVGGWQDVGWQKSVWRQLLYGAPYVHLHFVFRLGGLYLITPLLRVYVRHAPLKLRAAMVALLLTLGAGDSTVAAFLHTQSNAFSLLWPFLAFYLAGDVLRSVTVTRRMAAWSVVGYAVCVAGMAGGTGLLLAPGAKPTPFPSIDMMLYDFLNPLRIGMAFCAWFILAYVFREQGDRHLFRDASRCSRSGRKNESVPLQRVMHFLAPLTLGIYLVHPLFREVLWKNDVFSRPNWLFGSAAALAVIAAGSLVLTYILSRIPYVRRIVG
jgi:surface polysaccharide O-acyltransferase-like enzyme